MKETSKTVNPKSKSDKREMPPKRTEERGMGSEFANSVASVLEDARNTKGSSSSFLGVDKKDIDITQFTDSLTERKKR